MAQKKYWVIPANGREGVFLVVAARMGGTKTIKMFASDAKYAEASKSRAEEYAQGLNNGTIKEVKRRDK